MTRQLRSTLCLRTPLALILIVLTVFTGCTPTQPFYFHEDGDLSHYLDHATAIEEPVYSQPHLEDVEYSQAPMTISDSEFREMWDLSLEEVISISLQNSKVIRNIALVGANRLDPARTDLKQFSQGLPSIYDPALSSSLTSFGNFANVPNGPGVENALAAFDTQLSIVGDQGTNGLGGRNFLTNTDRINNFFGQNNAFFNNTSQGGIEAALQKKTATGLELRASSRTDHTRGNAFFNPIHSTYWEQAFTVEANMPLLQGSGTLINRAPVVLARISEDISLVHFQNDVTDLVADIEDAYWNLHFSYRALDTAKIGRDAAQATWNNVYEKLKGGIENAQAEAQAREQYFFFRAGLENALQVLQGRENDLRFLMGIAASDGRLIRPIDEPVPARVHFDWRQIHEETLLRSLALREQKWRIEASELNVAQAKNRLLPQLDVGANYRWYGAGDNLINADRNGLNFPQNGSTAFDVLTEGGFQEAGLSFSFAMPVGYRRELANVRNATLDLIRNKARLEDLELAESHLLSKALRTVDFHYVAAQSQFNRWKASQAEVDSVEALYRGGKSTLDLVLDAQRRRADAQLKYYEELTNYMKSMAHIHYRKGSLLEYNNIHMAEGPWADKAYWDALGHARERDASYYLNYGYTRPGVVSQGPVAQGPVSEYIGDLPIEGSHPGGGATEEVPTPAPTPSERPAPDDDAPQEPGPITTRPEGPIFNAPRRAETPRGSTNVASRPVNAIEWGSWGQEKTSPAPDGNPLRQASFAEPLRK